MERMNEFLGGEEVVLDVKCVQGVTVNLYEQGIPVFMATNDYKNKLEKQGKAFTNRVQCYTEEPDKVEMLIQDSP